MVSITAADVREAGDLDSAEYPDTELQFEINAAEAIVNDDLAPYSDSTNRLELVAALIAAAYAADERTVTEVTSGQETVVFSSDESLTLWRQAKQIDPTGRLGMVEKSVARIDVPEVK